MSTIPSWKDKILFTPGPLTTSRTVKQAMLRDLGSRDFEFIQLVKNIRQTLLELGGVSKADYESIIMQGSGTYGLESVLSSITPPNGKWLIIINGAYGQRLADIANTLNIKLVDLSYPENSQPKLNDIEQSILIDENITHLAMVHCETSTGMINPVEAVGHIAKKNNKQFFVDAMSSFGAVPLNLAQNGIDYLVSSANKCLEGVPGVSFIIANKTALLQTEGYARSVSLDLLAQWQGLEKNGQFRFTPPTHALLAFQQALQELKDEGGVLGRVTRYKHNHKVLLNGMREMGFKEYLKPEEQGYIITAFHYPNHSNFNFEDFYKRLNEKDFVIYPGKVSHADCFRIGSIGRIFEADVKALLAAIKQTLLEMNIKEL